MWQKENKDNQIINLALLLVLASTPMAATLMVPSATRAQSAENPNFELPENVPSGTKIKIDSSDGMVGINESLKSKFEEQFSGTEVEIATSDTQEALQSVLDGEADIAAVNYELTPEEKAKGLQQLLLNREKIAIVVGKDNPFTGSLTSEQFARIFRGEITNWSELGGASGKIRLIDRPNNSDIRQAFRNYPVFKQGKFATGSNATQISTDDTAEIVSQLGKDGISYVLASQLDNLPQVQTLALHKTKPDNPKYPFSLPSVYIYQKNPSPRVNNFLGFTSNKPGQESIKQAIAKQADAIAQKVSTQAPTDGDNSSNNQSSPENSQTTAASSLTTGTENNSSSNNSSSSTTNTTDTQATNNTNAVGDTTGEGNERQVLTPGATSNSTNTITNTDEGLSWWWQLLLGLLGASGLLFILGRKKNKEETTPTAIKEGTNVPPVAPISGTGETPTTDTIPSPPSDTVDNSPNTNNSSLDLEAPVAVVNPSYPSQYGKQEPPSPENPNPGGINIGGGTIAAGIAGMAGVGAAAAALGNKKQSDDTPDDNQEFDSETLDKVADAAEPSLISSNTDTQETTLFLTAQSESRAYAEWEISPSDSDEAIGKKGDKHLTLRLYDVTDIDLSYQSPKLVKQYECGYTDNNCFVEIPLSDRDYMAELGYADEKDWQPLTRSNIIRVFSSFEGEASTNGTSSPLDGIKAATGGVAATAAASFWSAQSTAENESTVSVYPTAPIKDGESTLVLTNRTPKWAYASWNVSEIQKTELQHQGGKQLALRLYDVTDIDLSYQTPKLVQQYECDQTTSDRFVAIPASDRDYMAEIGYITGEERWLLLARSATIRVFNRSGQEFWFVTDAELLIHGATEAGATVKIGDRPIKLKSDGTFHLRIPFTDRLIDCVMEACDGDSQNKRMIHQQFHSDSFPGDDNI
ncbi:MAG: DUF4912 domain-containing protein [Calothrix sp. MO_167.B42]|nr:DUF4912 domain-containing protein [Calothrix sp. MO_167.B42]